MLFRSNCRVNRKIDPEQILFLANQAQIDISDFTKWKCELVISAWKKQSADVQKALSGAITTEPGRPTFSIELNQE